MLAGLAVRLVEPAGAFAPEATTRLARPRSQIRIDEHLALAAFASAQHLALCAVGAEHLNDGETAEDAADVNRKSARTRVATTATTRLTLPADEILDRRRLDDAAIAANFDLPVANGAQDDLFSVTIADESVTPVHGSFGHAQKVTHSSDDRVVIRPLFG